MQKLKWWVVHLVVFVLGQGVLLAVGQSWPGALLAGGVPEPLTLASAPAMWISRVWCVVFGIDTIWSWSKVVLGRRTERAGGDA